MRTTLYQYQVRGAEFHLAHHYSLNTCEMGLGKSVQALAVSEKVGGETLIFCPAFLRANWENEIKIHLGAEFIKRFLIIPYSTLSSKQSGFAALYQRQFKTIIADEAHYLKNPDSNRTRKFLDLLIKLKPEYFIGLTGTPIKNRLSEFYTLLSAVSMNPRKTSGINVKQYFPTLDSFCDRYCYKQELSFSGSKYIQYFGINRRRITELRELLEHKIYKVRPEDQVKLPPLIHKKVFTQLIETDDMLKEYEAYVLGGKSVTAKKASAVLKVKFTIEYVDDIVSQGVGPVVVFTDHVDPAVTIAKHFNVEPIHGGTAVDRRVELAKKLNEGSLKVLVATIGSFSVGVNLTAAKNLVFNDISWIPADNFQAMKRIHRIGQNETCVIHHILGGHVDEFILDMVKKKMEVINSV